MSRVLIASALAALVLFAAAPSAVAEPDQDIFLAHAQRQDAGADPAAASEFRHRLAELTGGRLRVGIFADGQLGGNRDTAKLVAKGVIQSALISVGGLAPLFPPLAVTAMPFALDSPEAAYLLYDGPFGRALAAEIETSAGLVVLGFADAGGMHIITNSRRPVHSPADLKGLKIRAIPGYEVLDAMILGLGAVPVNVSSREELSALEAGIVDGQTNPASVVLSRHFTQVQGYATLTGHLYAPYVWIYNRATFQQLSPADQGAVRQAARDAVLAGRALSARLDRSERGVAGLGKRIEVDIPSPAERDVFKAATQPKVAAALAKKLGDDGTRRLAEFMDAARQANHDARK